MFYEVAGYRVLYSDRFFCKKKKKACSMAEDRDAGELLLMSVAGSENTCVRRRSTSNGDRVTSYRLLVTLISKFRWWI